MQRWTLTLGALWLVAAALAPTRPATAAAPEGDADASALANRMLEALGGRAVWSAARSIRVELSGHYAREREPWQETFWMDLEAPNGRFELRGGDVDRVIAWTPAGGWELSGGKLEAMAADRHAFELEYWRRQPVVIFHRLARGGPGVRVAQGDDAGRFDVFDGASGELLAQFALNRKDEPIKWGAKIGDREFEHVFGPLKTFAGLRMPCWGSSLDGIWRYEHQSVALSTSPIAVSLDPPGAAP